MLLQARRHSDDGTHITVEASVRDDNVVAELEALRPDDRHGSRQSSRITCIGRSHAVEIDGVVVEATAGRSRAVRIEATKSQERHDRLRETALNDWTPEDLTELALRTALLGDRSPLGDMTFMAKIDNPIPHIDQLGLDEDSFVGAAEVLLVESLVGSGRAERITDLRIGPARSGRPIRLEWVPSRRFSNVEPERRQIEGKLSS